MFLRGTFAFRRRERSGDGPKFSNPSDGLQIKGIAQNSCRRCSMLIHSAERKLRIHLPPAESLRSIGPSAAASHRSTAEEAAPHVPLDSGDRPGVRSVGHGGPQHRDGRAFLTLLPGTQPDFSVAWNDTRKPLWGLRPSNRSGAVRNSLTGVTLALMNIPQVLGNTCIVVLLRLHGLPTG
jgi:hypothetical protein